MNICYVTEYFYPFTIGGAEVSTYHHAKALIQAGHRVVIITPNFGAKTYEEIEGIGVYRFFFPNRLALGEVCNSLYFTNLIYYLHLAFNICKVAFKIKFDVIHAQNTFSIVGAYIASKILKTPFFLSLRDYMSVCPVGALCLHYKDLPPVKCSFLQYYECFLEFQKKYHPESGFWKKIKAFLSTMAEIVDFKVRQRALKGAKEIVTVSNAVKKIYSSTGVDTGKLITIYNFAPEPIFDSILADRIKNELNLENKKVVLYVGKMSFGKGTDVLIRAIPEVLEKFPNACFIFAGRENPLIPIPAFLNRNVKILGHISNNKVHALYSLCDLVVIPSVWQEPFPRAALEALIYEKPIIATKVGGIPEIIRQGVDGILIDKNDSYVLSETIIEILDKGCKQDVIGNTKKHLKHKQEQAIERLLKLYR